MSDDVLLSALRLIQDILSDTVFHKDPRLVELQKLITGIKKSSNFDPTNPEVSTLGCKI